MNLDMIKEILNDEEAMALLRELILKDEKNKPQNDAVYVWCEKAVTIDGENLYAPLVTFKPEIMVPTSAQMCEAENYIMLYDKNQFKAYNYEPMINLICRMSGADIKLIAVPGNVFEQLKRDLKEFLNVIFEKTVTMFETIEFIAEKTKSDPEDMKRRVCVEILSGLHNSRLYSALTESMSIVNGSDVEYMPDEDEEDCEDEEDEYDEDEYDEDYDEEYDEDDEV